MVELDSTDGFPHSYLIMRPTLTPFGSCSSLSRNARQSERSNDDLPGYRLHRNDGCRSCEVRAHCTRNHHWAHHEAASAAPGPVEIHKCGAALPIRVQLERRAANRAARQAPHVAGVLIQEGT